MTSFSGQFSSPLVGSCGNASIWIAKTLDMKESGSFKGFVSAMVVVAVNNTRTTYKEDGDDGKDQHDLQV